MSKFSNSDYSVTGFFGIYRKPKNYISFLWHAASLFQSWEVKNVADMKHNRWRMVSRFSIALAHHLWLQKNPDRAHYFYEAIAVVDRFSQPNLTIPPKISTFLTTVYQEMNLVR